MLNDLIIVTLSACVTINIYYALPKDKANIAAAAFCFCMLLAVLSD